MLIRQDTHTCQAKFWQTAQVRKIWIIALLLSVTACSNSQPVLSNSILQNDVTSISINEVNTFSVSRVVVLANGVAEIISALNAKSILVGRDISSTDEDLKNIPIVTSGHQIIPERVISLNPDLVIIDAASGPKAAIDQIRAAGIKVVETPESWTLADIALKVKGVSAAIGAPVAGDELVTALNKQILRTDVINNPRIAFLYLRGTSSIYLIGGPGSGADSLIQAAGGIDVGVKEFPRAFNTLTAESLAALNPEILLVMSKGLESVGGLPGLLKLPGVAQTDAGKNSAVIDVDDSLLLSFGPRTFSLVNELSTAIAKLSK